MKVRSSVLKTLAVVATVSLAGCVLGQHNPILGKWEVTSVTATDASSPSASMVATTFSGMMKGEIFDFKNHNFTVYNPNTKETISSKVLKYEVKSAHKIVVVQKQEKDGLNVTEYQKGILSDGGKDLVLDSGIMAVHFKRM